MIKRLLLLLSLINGWVYVGVGDLPSSPGNNNGSV